MSDVPLSSIILRDSARAHTADAVEDLLRRWRWELLEHPPHSPDMSPRDYDLFAKMKEPLRGTRYSTTEEIIHAVGRSLLDINRSGRSDGVPRLPQIWQVVVHMGGDYIEGMCVYLR
jgi:histone-lysine N-methyltransferase SETMAR